MKNIIVLAITAVMLLGCMGMYNKSDNCKEYGVEMSCDEVERREVERNIFQGI